MITMKLIVFVLLLNFILGSGLAPISGYDGQLNAFEQFTQKMEQNHNNSQTYAGSEVQGTTSPNLLVGFIEGALNLKALFDFFINTFLVASFLTIYKTTNFSTNIVERLFYFAFFLLQMTLNGSLIILFIDKIRGQPK